MTFPCATQDQKERSSCSGESRLGYSSRDEGCDGKRLQDRYVQSGAESHRTTDGEGLLPTVPQGSPLPRSCGRRRERRKVSEIKPEVVQDELLSVSVHTLCGLSRSDLQYARTYAVSFSKCFVVEVSLGLLPLQMNWVDSIFLLPTWC